MRAVCRGRHKLLYSLVEIMTYLLYEIQTIATTQGSKTGLSNRDLTITDGIGSNEMNIDLASIS